MREPGVIVCGESGIAVPITDHLLAAGAPVTVVVRTADAAARATRGGVGVVVCAGPIGDALVEAGLETADAVVCVEDGEMANLETALVARRLRPDVRVVTRLANATASGLRPRDSRAWTVSSAAWMNEDSSRDRSRSVQCSNSAPPGTANSCRKGPV